MNKIPTIFMRDLLDDRYIINQKNADCDWVFRRMGSAYELYNGHGCLISNNQIYKRHIISLYHPVPKNFISCGVDAKLKIGYGWLPVSQSVADKPFRRAFEAHNKIISNPYTIADGKPHATGTFELVGPGIKDNYYNYDYHWLISHKENHLDKVPRNYDSLIKLFDRTNYYGIVFLHKDGRMAKIKRSDFIEFRTIEYKRAV